MPTEASPPPQSPPGSPQKLGGRLAWLIWSLSALAFGYAFFHRVAPGVMVADLMGEFTIGAAILGTLSALYFYPYVLLQIPIGTLMDRYGPRLMMVVALLIAALGSLLFATTTSLEFAYLGRILIGIGCAAGFLGSLSLAAKWFPPHQFAFLAGLILFAGMVSGMLANAPLATFMDAFGWRASQWGLAIIGFTLAMLILFFVRNSPTDNRLVASGNSESWSTVWQNLKQALRLWEIWKIALVGATMSGPMLTLGGLWGTPYFMTAFDMGRTEAAFWVSLMLLGWAFAAPFFGWLSARTGQNRSLVRLGSGILCLATASLVFIPNLPAHTTVAILVIMGVSGASMSILFAAVRTATPEPIHGVASGMLNSLTVASGAVLQPLVGLVLDRVWNGQLEDGVRIYEPSDYRLAFGLILASVLIGFLLSLRMKH